MLLIVLHLTVILLGNWSRVVKKDFSLFVSLHYLKIFYKQVIFYSLKTIIVFCFKQPDWTGEEKKADRNPPTETSIYPCERLSLENDYPTVLGTSPYYQAFLPLSRGCLVVYAFKMTFKNSSP